MKKIAVIGTHGVGKTTLSHQICVALKESHFNSTIVEEKARSCPFPINEAAVIDRCSLDAIVYWHDRNTPHPYFEKLREAALEWVKTQYDLIVLVEPSSDTDSFAVDAVRDSSIIYRNRIRDLFREYTNSLPESTLDRIVRIESDQIFDKSVGHSVAVDVVMQHPSYPVKRDAATVLSC